MHRPCYVQREIGNFAPVGITVSDTVRFNVFFGVEDGQVALRFEQEKGRNQDYISIARDSMVEITLQSDQLFFSKMMHGITTKEDLSTFYGGLEYDGYDEKLDRYKIVRFTARYNRNGKYDTSHAFNLNVDFLQSYCENKGAKWIPLTIDPDIKNPPPMVSHS